MLGILKRSFKWKNYWFYPVIQIQDQKFPIYKGINCVIPQWIDTENVNNFPCKPYKLIGYFEYNPDFTLEPGMINYICNDTSAEIEFLLDLINNLSQDW